MGCWDFLGAEGNSQQIQELITCTENEADHCSFNLLPQIQEFKKAEEQLSLLIGNMKDWNLYLPQYKKFLLNPLPNFKKKINSQHTFYAYIQAAKKPLKQFHIYNISFNNSSGISIMQFPAAILSCITEKIDKDLEG